MNQHSERPRILVTDFHHLGDIVLAFPFLRAAQEHFEVHLCCRSAVKDVAALVLPDEQIHLWDPPWHEETKSLKGNARVCSTGELVTHWRSMKFAAAVSVWSDPRVHLLWAKAGISQRIGFPPTPVNHYGSHLPERAGKVRISAIFSPLLRLLAGGRPLLTNPLYREPANPHQLEAWKKIALALHLPWSDDSPWLSDFSDKEIPGALRSPRSSGKKILIAHMGGRLPTKLWPSEYWRTTLEALRDRLEGWQICVLTGPEDAMPPEVSGILTLPPPARVEQLASLLQHADFVLSHDSFPAHLAHAVGTKVLAIFGSGDPAWFAPGGNATNAISINECPWRPCLDECRMPAQICLANLRAPSVIAAVLERCR
jgi:ADP-heptose:LPS heptosyltransferase